MQRGADQFASVGSKSILLYSPDVEDVGLHTVKVTVSDGKKMYIYQDLMQTVQMVELDRVKAAQGAWGGDPLDPTNPFKPGKPTDENITSKKNAA
jgi:hypothetical protein